jgi:hypothetical protein
MTMDEVEKLKAENEALRKRMGKLEGQVNPPPRQPYNYQPVDRTAGMSMDRATMQAMIDAVPESVMQGIRADARKPNPVTEASSSPLSTSHSAQSQPAQRGTGWVPERGFPDRTKEFELVDRIVKKMVGGPNDPVK